MKIIQKNISEIKPDKKQPRKQFTEKMIKEMSVSIKNEGVINPIEIDSNDIIITGEVRWRASKEAGLETVPCKVIKINDNDRFIRQMQENIHHNTMNAIDTAEGFKKTLEIITNHAAGFVRDKRQSGEYFQKGSMELSKLYGVSQTTISNYLRLLKEVDEIKEHVKRGDISYTKLNEINTVPEKYRDRFKKKAIEQNYISRESIRAIRAGLARSNMFGNDKISEEIMSFDYKDEDGVPMTQREVILKINDIIPDTQTVLAKDIDRVKRITQIAADLGDILKDNTLSSINEPLSKMSLTFQLKVLIVIVGKYLETQVFDEQLIEIKEDRKKLIKE